MKILRKLSLRWRLTILTAIILILACVTITLISIFLAQSTFVKIKMDFAIDGELPPPQHSAILYTRNTQDFRISVFSGMLGVVILGTLATYVIAGKALKPATDLSRAIEARDESNLFVPVVTENSNDEVSKLGSSFNNLIEKLKLAYEEQKRFSANAAHEMKTPLASIIASIEVLKLDDNPSQAEVSEAFDSIYESSNRLSNLVNDLLEIYSVHNKISDVFTVTEIIDNVVNELEDAAALKGTAIETEIMDFMLKGEKRLIESAILNVVENAVKYNKQDGSIKIKTYVVNKTAHITVKDTGIGIDEKELDRIFEPFYCVDKSRSRSLGGSGLGLSLVKTIIERHHGGVQINSVINEFTEIDISLPIY